VTLTVTNGFGARLVQQATTGKSSGNETVLALLKGHATVVTAHGSAFVQSIDGLGDHGTGGQPVNWFYYVNGVQAPKGAAATTLNAGDRVWWDRHNSAADNVPAVVGSYPAPFAGGIDGERYPVTEICSAPSGAACATVAGRLRAVGVPLAFGALGTDEPQTLRVLVGPWTALRIDPTAVYLQQGPALSGVYGRFPSNGSQLSLLDGDGRVTRTVSGSVGLVAADVIPMEVPTWLVTGTDTAGVDAAAHALDASILRDHFAVAIVAGRVVPLPVSGP